MNNNRWIGYLSVRMTMDGGVSISKWVMDGLDFRT